ncbi:phage virion morphogenesis protein [Cellvibrio sp. PSBB023]|uniref:phage virion morphogenesis protein n=1 Tax=Cellvibrio sp. PSBB023 TaxID=1945512 RepID=UPI00098FB9AE|nr:phage virion morphogenesis protein [Cellvibrio sp. PSBB023]AQT58714.1 phage virion morphogenesis protein [Cellvibrio sp. PSBB023]
MAGASFEYDDAAAQERLNQLQEKLGDLTPALQDIGEYLMNSHQQRFKDQVAPDGTPWAPLSPSYQRNKARNKNRILVLNGYLEKSFRYQVGNNELNFGTNVPYAAHHHFGTKPYTIKPKTKKALAFGGAVVKKVNHPGLKARPLIGVSEADTEEILRLLDEHLEL